MKYFALVLLAGLMAGCATVMSRNGMGLVFTDVKDTVMATTNVARTKKGEACATNILSIVSTGDMSVETAKRSAGITKVSSIDYSQYAVLGVFAKTCTIVTGE